jgi:hypothetical protein
MKSIDAALGKAIPPFADRVLIGLDFLENGLVLYAGSGGKHDPRSRGRPCRLADGSPASDSTRSTAATPILSFNDRDMIVAIIDQPVR